MWQTPSPPVPNEMQAPTPNRPNTAGSVKHRFTIKQKRFAVEVKNPVGRINLWKNALRKDIDNFVYNHQKNLLICQGPRHTGGGGNPNCDGYILIYGTSGTCVAVGNSLEACDFYISWIRKKVRGLICAGPVAAPHALNQVNMAVHLEPCQPPPPESEIRVGELYLTLKHHFPHWDVIYNSNLSPFLCFKRRPENLFQHNKFPVVLAPHMLDSLDSLEKCIYDLLLKEANEEAALNQISLKASSIPASPAIQLERDIFDSRSGRRALFLVSPHAIIIHGIRVRSCCDRTSLHSVQDEAELQPALIDLMPILSCFTSTRDSLQTQFDFIVPQNEI